MDFFCKTITLLKNKNIEFQLSSWGFGSGFTFIEVDSKISWKTDHAGFMFSLTILNLYFGITFYDQRHWCDDKERYLEKEDYQKEHEKLNET